MPCSPTHTLVFVVLVLTVTTPDDAMTTWSMSAPASPTGTACRTCQPFRAAHWFSLRPTSRSPLAPMANDPAFGMALILPATQFLDTGIDRLTIFGAGLWTLCQVFRAQGSLLRLPRWW